MRNNPLSEGTRWLAQAKEDLFWAEHLANHGGYHLACFLAQQVTEMALKAYLFAQGEEVVLGHSVERLGQQAADYHPEFQTKVKTWSILDSYYIPTRYPNGLPDGIPAHVFTEKAAQDAVAIARQAVEFVDGLLSNSEQ